MPSCLARIRRLGIVQADSYALVVLALLFCTYLLNQVNRFMLAVVSKDLQVKIGFGDGQGGGTQYDVLAGPVFIVLYSVVGLPVAILAERFHRRNILVLALVTWSLASASMAFCTTYWQLVLARALQGIGESGCSPVAASLIADYFDERARGGAMALYAFAIYFGSSLAFGAGNALAERYGFEFPVILFGLAGLPLACAIVGIVREPKRRTATSEYGSTEATSVPSRPIKIIVRDLGRFLCSRAGFPFLVLCVAGAVRNAAGYIWAYNAENFLTNERGMTPDGVASYLGWIPLVFGPAAALLGGLVSDVVAARGGGGSGARTWVLVISLFLAVPCALGVVLLPAPSLFAALSLVYLCGEQWVGIVLALVVEMAPPQLRASCASVYVLIISIFGGNAVLLVEPVRKATGSLAKALLLLFPTAYAGGAVLFFFAGILIRMHPMGDRAYVPILKRVDDDDDDDDEHDAEAEKRGPLADIDL